MTETHAHDPRRRQPICRAATERCHLALPKPLAEASPVRRLAARGRRWLQSGVLLAAASAFAAGGSPPAPELKPRVIVLTDLKRTHETDDSQSLVRLLAHADLVEIEAIIISSGANYWRPEHAVDGYGYAFELLQAYERSLPNLMKRSEQTGFDTVETTQRIGYWPSARYLGQRLALGTPLQGFDKTGPGRSNDGSRLITSVVDEPDARPVYVLAWGGANVLAQALRDLTETASTRRSDDAVAAWVRKLRVIAIADQDQPWNRRHEPPGANNSGQWLRRQFPGLHYVWLEPGWFLRASRDRQPFYQMHVQGHGALGDAYPDHSNGVEGDTPALFHVLPVGAGDPEHPEWGTLSGLAVYGEHPVARVNVFTPYLPGRGDVAEAHQSFSARSVVPMWNSLAARLDWARSGTGNRPPRIVLEGDTTTRIMRRDIRVGAVVTLDASATHDAENDRLTFQWELLPVPGAFTGALALTAADTPRLSFSVPAEAAGQALHLLLTVTDDGAGHPLTAWKRVVLDVIP